MYLTHRWNVSYQYELNRVGHFKYLDIPNSLPWDYGLRPLDTDAQFAKIDDTDFTKYRLMVLHFDENVANSDQLVHFTKLLALPVSKLLVCHGAPPVRGSLSSEGIYDLEPNGGAHGVIADLVNKYVIVHPNDMTRKLWGFRNGVVIEPTLSDFHYPYVKKTMARAVTVSANPAFMPEYSGYHLMRQSCTALDFCDLIGTDSTGFINEVNLPKMGLGYEMTQGLAVEDLARRRFYDRMSLMGSYSCYFNTSLRNPWNTAMHEALLLGCAVVTTDHFCESEYIKNGYDGFIAKDALEMRNAIIFLSKNFDTAVLVGQRARERALKRMRASQFKAKWKSLLESM